MYKDLGQRTLNDLLIYSIDDWNIEKTEKLLKAGAEVDSINPIGGRTCLMMSAEAGNLDFVKLFLRYDASIDRCDYMGNTVMMRAVQMNGNNSEIVKALEKEMQYLSVRSKMAYTGKRYSAINAACDPSEKYQLSKELMAEYESQLLNESIDDHSLNQQERLRF